MRGHLLDAGERHVGQTFHGQRLEARGDEIIGEDLVELVTEIGRAVKLPGAERLERLDLVHRRGDDGNAQLLLPRLHQLALVVVAEHHEGRRIGE